MFNVLSADFSRFLAQLHMRLSPNDKMELVMAMDDISGGTADDPIESLNDRRVKEKPRMAIQNLIQEYAA